MRKCLFGSTGRFSQDIDLDASETNGFEDEVDAAFRQASPFHGITFEIANFRYSEEGNFNATVNYRHEHGTGSFELQISYRLDPILDGQELILVDQAYFRRVEFIAPRLFGLSPYEMVGEKIMACNRRIGGSGKDVYDLFLWAGRPFDKALVRSIAALKAWTDQSDSPRYDPVRFISLIEPKNFRWTDISRLVPRKLVTDPERICKEVRDRFAFLAACTDMERKLVDDQTSHRHHSLFRAIKNEARRLSAQIV